MSGTGGDTEIDRYRQRENQQTNRWKGRTTNIQRLILCRKCSTLVSQKRKRKKNAAL